MIVSNVQLFPAKKNERIKHENIRMYFESDIVDDPQCPVVHSGNTIIDYKLRVATLPDTVMDNLGPAFDARVSEINHKSPYLLLEMEESPRFCDGETTMIPFINRGGCVRFKNDTNLAEVIDMLLELIKLVQKRELPVWEEGKKPPVLIDGLR